MSSQYTDIPVIADIVYHRSHHRSSLAVDSVASIPSFPTVGVLLRAGAVCTLGATGVVGVVDAQP
ncbi:MAG: hypothetical protein WCD51_02755 [Anaerolineae bacterium]